MPCPCASASSLALLLTVTFTAFPAPAQPASADQAAAVVLKPCTLAGLEEQARCGTLSVPLTQDGADGRRIELAVAVLPAREEMPAPDPLVILQGGPGQGAVGLAPFYAEVFAGVRETRAVVLLDQRGTGGSSPLACDPLVDFPPGDIALIGPLAKTGPLTLTRSSSVTIF